MSELNYAYITIEKDLIPYNFDIMLKNIDNEDTLYKIKMNYNTYSDFFTVSLYYNDELLIDSEKLILNQPLFKKSSEDENLNIDSKFPKDVIIPMSMNDKVNKITFENLNDPVILFIVNRDVLTL